MARSRKTRTDPTAETAAEPAAVAMDAASSVEPAEGPAAPTESLATEEPATQPGETGQEDMPEPPATEEPVTEHPAAPPDAGPVHPAFPVPRPRRGGFVAPLLGGVAAAGLGFGLAAYVLPTYISPPTPTEAIDGLTAQIAAQDDRIGALGAELAALRADPAVAEEQAAFATRVGEDLAAVTTTVGDIGGRIDDLATRIGGIEDRLTALEKRPTAEGAASATALEAFGREMEQLRSAIDAQKAETAEAEQRIAAMTEEAAARLKAAEEEAARQRDLAAEATRQAAVRAAVGRLQAALESGGSLEGGLADLTAAGVTPPAALADQAQGVPSLAALREAFPPAARDALAASLKQEAGGGTWNRITAFLRSQSGARSLTPRAGDDPDAILSRAEAAVQAGDLAMALDEIAQLPPDGQARMAEWTALAERRMEAAKAVAALAAENE